MKNVRLLITVLMLTTNTLFSQKKGKNEILVSVGVITSNGFLSNIESIIEGAFSRASYENSSPRIAYTITYKKAIENNWFVFVDGSYQNIHKNMVKNKLVIGASNQNFYTIGVGSDYHYLTKEWCQIYSGISIAYTIQKTTNKHNDNNTTFVSNNKFFNFQINALGLRIGKEFAGTLELGYGYKGVINLGTSYQF